MKARLSDPMLPKFSLDSLSRCWGMPSLDEHRIEKQISDRWPQVHEVLDKTESSYQSTYLKTFGLATTLIYFWIYSATRTDTVCVV